MPSQTVIPLFPLGLVLLPQMPLPLHIFEERYKLMIGECIDSHTAFGLVFLTEAVFRQWVAPPVLWGFSNAIAMAG